MAQVYINDGFQALLERINYDNDPRYKDSADSQRKSLCFDKTANSRCRGFAVMTIIPMVRLNKARIGRTENSMVIG